MQPQPTKIYENVKSKEAVNSRNHAVLVTSCLCANGFNCTTTGLFESSSRSDTIDWVSKAKNLEALLKGIEK